MDLRSTPRLPAFAFRLCSYLNAMQLPTGKAGVDTLVSADGGPLTKSTLTPATADDPAWYAAETADFVVVAIAGASQLSHATATMSGYAGSITDSRTNPQNAYFRARATALENALAALGYTEGKQWVMAGHSLGGALAEIITADRVQAGLRNSTCLCTFGAPKPFDVEGARQVAIERRARWMASDDPVPLVCPTTDDTLSILLAYSWWTCQRFGNFCHGADGISISPQAVLTPAVLPADAQMNASGSLAGWLLAVDGSSSSGHHLTSYLARLSLWLQQHPGAQPLPSAGPAEPPAGSGNRRLLTRQEQQLAANITAFQHRQNLGEPSLPAQQVFNVRRFGRTFTVTFGGEVVAVSGSRRGAHQLARTFNAALRSLQHQAVVDTTNLTEQFREYLSLATDAASGFSPTMNTTLPTA